MMKFKQLTALLLGSAFVLVACGQPVTANGKPVQVSSEKQTSEQTSVSDAVNQAITNSLEKNFAAQKLKIKSIQTTPIKDVYEVVVNGKNIVYTDSKGEYVFLGELIDVKSGESLTEARQSELRNEKVDFAKLPLDKAITEVRGNGKLKIAVFTDVDCPYCRRLEKEFAKMTDITIYNFMMPIDTLHPKGFERSMQILCQKDPTLAWTSLMRENKQPEPVPECPTSLKETIQLGEELGINGTPALILPNGKVHSGFMALPQLQQFIENNQ